MNKYELRNMNGTVMGETKRKHIQKACNYFSSLFNETVTCDVCSDNIAFIHIYECGCSVCYGVFKNEM